MTNISLYFMPQVDDNI